MAAPRVINPPIQPQRHAEGTAENKRGNEDGRRQPPSEIRPLEEAKEEVHTRVITYGDVNVMVYIRPDLEAEKQRNNELMWQSERA